MFIDVHAHLHAKEFDRDREEVILRAREHGVQKIINVGFDVEGNFRALALAKASEAKLSYPKIYATFGIHPHLASEWNDSVGAKIFETVKKEPKVVALGEMGLDFYKNFQPREVQQKAFEGQLTMARELGLPVIIHCRDAFMELFEILKKQNFAKGKVLLHCFTGSLEVAKEAWKRGFYTSFTGIITYPTAEDLRTVVKQTPFNHLLLETDCPFLAPQKYRGKRNEPAFILGIYEEVSAIREESSEVIGKGIEKNVKEFFGI